MIKKSSFQFTGGLTLPGEKNKSAGHPIVAGPLPEKFIIPLQQHAGAPCRPVVTIGQTVKKGELIGYSGQDQSVGVHASTSGIIRDIAPHPMAHPSGLSIPCILLDSDGQDEWIPAQPYRGPRNSLDDVQQHLQRMGIAGLGGGIFPSHLKLSSGIHTLIGNGAECEPYISCDDQLMREEAEKILESMALLGEILGVSTLLLGIEDNKPEAISALQKAQEHNQSPVTIIVTPTKYPMGGAKQLIYCLTNVSIPQGKRTTHYGFQCFNIATLLAIRHALIDGYPLIDRIVTVSGNITQGQNYRVRLGTPIQNVLAHHDPNLHPSHVVIGGPLMGFAVDTLSCPVVKSTNCILIPDSSWLNPPPEMPCIRCGACVPACPVQLQPHELYWLSKGAQWDKAEKYHLFDCIECGCCSYVCPSHIPLVSYYQYAKDHILEKKSKQEDAQRAKIHFETKKKRMERAEKEKAERFEKKLRNQSQNMDEEKRAAIQAALKRNEERLAKRAPSTPDELS